MWPSVRNAFLAFSKPLEGYVPNMYLDVKGLVTTGMGNLIDSAGAAQVLPWRHSDGSLASSSEIASAWNGVKAAQGQKSIGGGNTFWKNLNDLRLDDDGIQQLISGKLDANESSLRGRFPGYDNWPADAQLGLHSMSWAMGPAFKFPKFQAAVNQVYPDFRTAAIESHMNDVGNPGLVPRNIANAMLFNNAATALEQHFPLDQLIWHPGQVAGAAIQAVSQEASQQAQQVAAYTQRNWGKALATAAVIGGGIWGAVEYFVNRK